MAKKESQISRQKRIHSRFKKLSETPGIRDLASPRHTQPRDLIDRAFIDIKNQEQFWRELTQPADQARRKRGQKTVDDVLDVAVQLALVGTPRRDWSSKIRQRTNVSQRHVQNILKKHWNVLQHRIKQHHSRR